MKKIFKIFPFLISTRKFIYLNLSGIDKLLGRSNPVVILCYHAIANDNWRFSVNFNELKKQILYLKYSGYEFITLDDIVDVVEGKKSISKPSVVITIDDGYKNILSARAFFKKQGIRPTLFILSNTLSANRGELDINYTFLTTPEIKLLIKDGWLIGSHSGTHANLSTINKNLLRDEIVDSKKSLEKELDLKINYFAYPKGKYSKIVLRLVKKAGYKMGLSMDDGFITAGANILKLPRVGVDRSHSLNEFKTLYSPSVISFRKLIKSTPIARMI